MNIPARVGRELAVSIFGVRLVGLTAENGIKLLLTVGLLLALWLIGKGLRTLARLLTRGRKKRACGVRGDVVRVQFLYTTVMEMGQPPVQVKIAGVPAP